MKCIKIVTLVLGATLLFVSCKKFVQVDLPKSQLVRETVFKDLSTANAAMVHIYSVLRNRMVLGNTGISDLTRICGLYSDELKYWNVTGNGSNDELVYSNNLAPSNYNVGAVWDNSYYMIYAANSIIEGLASNAASQVPTKDKENLTGEALFIRSFVHFYLTNLYGAIPYVINTDYVANNKASRIAKEEVLLNLEKDLKDAIAFLPEKYSDAERVRPNAVTARALLARVYLYHGKWQDAEDMAKLVLDNNLFGLVGDLKSVFLKGSPETIWQLSPNSPTNVAPEAGSYILVSAPPPNVSLTTGMVSSFDADDQRLAFWIGEIKDINGVPYYFAYKYKQRLGTGTSAPTEYSIQIRLAEMYLIRAEARAQMEKFQGARDDLNEIRHRAGLKPVDMSDKAELLSAILEERQRELFLEYPHRFFDLVRTGNTHLLSSKPGWDTNDVLWPIPEAELLINPNLKPQNNGY